jgi:glycosyltransferase involved in cell wall biosynthesis
MRLAVYTDYTYRREGDRIYAERAFALFLGELAEHLERLTIVGKVDPRPGRLRYPLSSRAGFVELPYYESLTKPVQAVAAMMRSLAAFWRVLDQVDGVWLLGPHPLALMFAGLAFIRRKSVALGVRQDFPRYVRARHPRSRWVQHAGDLLEFAWSTLARFVPLIAVGPALAAQYPRPRVLEMAVSLIREQDIAAAGSLPARRYDGGELTVLSVGRLEQEKNPLLLADIIALLGQGNQRWRLRVCGEGPLEGALAARLEELGLRGQVDLLGYVPHDAGLAEIYRGSHALLHVSWTEGLPQVLFEAFAARLPVVATAVGGVEAAAGEAAILVDPGDARAPAEALERIGSDAALREQLIAAGVAKVAQHTLEGEAHRVAEFLRSRGRRPDEEL